MARESLEQSLGKVVRELRTRLGVSQEELAFRAKLHRTYISLLERGKRNPSLRVIATLAPILGTTMADLVARVERRQRGV